MSSSMGNAATAADMGGSMPSAMPSSMPSILSDAGMDMSNYTVASNFLQEILDDSVLQSSDFAIARAFWYGMVIVIVLAGIFHWGRWVALKARLRAAAAKQPRPSSPSNPVSSLFAACTAVVREATYYQITPSSSKWIRIPPFGIILLLLTYLGYILGLEFYNVDIAGAQYWQARGLRAAWISVAQLPLLILLAGKNNLIGYAVGLSYERLQVFHRWIARIMLLTATFHGGFQSYGWNQYGVLQIEINTDTCIPTGFATWMILVWMVFSSFAPIRNFRYEIFLVQHIISWIGFVVAIFYHIPSTALSARIYVYIAIGFFGLDRLTRLARYGINNVKPGRATLASLPGEVTKIRVHASRVKRWSPGQHVFLSLPSLGMGQSHPATIASTPTSHDGDLVFILRAHRGFTLRCLRQANSASSSTTSLLPKAEATLDPLPSTSTPPTEETHTALIDGPYGGSHSDFGAFDTAVLIAGSTGITFTLPILLNLAHRASSRTPLPLRRVVFMWMIKSRAYTAWIRDELSHAAKALHDAGIELEVKIHVTCDPSFSDSDSPSGMSGVKAGCTCAHTSTDGPCCCDTSKSPTEKIDAVAATTTTTPTTITTLTSSPSSGGRGGSDDELAHATYASGRPALRADLWRILDRADGETGVAVCGPLGLSSAVRRAVAVLSDHRGAAKGTGAQGVYLHAEGFAW
ncbi:MAG: hypothetical protein M1838_001815 [Thelocarpon superellum]|nr:MAG: hypothetical protein M1838_001815 [Thelocarpon superellum]